MNELLAFAIEAHGGIERWRLMRSVEARMSICGALWESKGFGKRFLNSTVSVETRRQAVTMQAIGVAPVRYEPELVRIGDDGDEEACERHWPSHRLARLPEGSWDVAEAGLFNGRALWTYLTQPFLYAAPGFAVEEVEPWREAGETWRSLEITFPDDVASHSRRQITRFGPDGLIRRHDYSVDLLGGARGVNYVEEYGVVAGLSIPLRRRVYPASEDWQREEGPVLVSIDIHALRFEQAPEQRPYG